MFVTDCSLVHFCPEVTSAGVGPGIHPIVSRNVSRVSVTVIGSVMGRVTAGGMRGGTVAVSRRVAAGLINEVTKGMNRGIRSRVSGVGNRVVSGSVAA